LAALAETLKVLYQVFGHENISFDGMLGAFVISISRANVTLFFALELFS